MVVGCAVGAVVAGAVVAGVVIGAFLGTPWSYLHGSDSAEASVSHHGDRVRSRASIPLPAVALDPSSPVGRVVLARVEEVRAKPQSAPAWYRLGLAYQASNDAELARACLERAAALQPDAPRPHYHLGLLAEHSGDLDAAIDAMSKVVVLAPEYLPARIRLGEWLIERDELDAAADSFQSARRIDGGATHATVGLARVALRRDRPEEAEALLAPLCSSEFADPAVHRTRAAALRGLGRHDDAAASLAVARRPDTPLVDPWRAEIDAFRADLAARMEHAEALVRGGRAAQAIPLLAAMRREAPENVGILCNLAVAHRVIGEFDRASSLLETELRRVPQSWQVHYNLALTRFLRLDAARSASVPEEGPTNATLAPERLANIVPHADAAIRLNPAHAPALVLRGEIHAAVGEARAAAELFRRAAIADPSNPEWLVRQGSAELADGRAEEAVNTLRRALAAAPGQPRAIEALAEALTACGKPDEALELRRRAGSQPAPGGLVAEEWRR